MDVDGAITSIRNTKSMPELDKLRIEVAGVMICHGEDNFKLIQSEFIKAKNRLKRIPLRERT